MYRGARSSMGHDICSGTAGNRVRGAHLVVAGRVGFGCSSLRARATSAWVHGGANLNQNLRPCPGCGVLLPETAGSTHRYIGASPECWSAFGEVSGKEYGDFRYARVHRLTVDAYCAQHPGEPSPQAVRSVAVHLVGLLLQMERDLDPEELYAVHKRMSSLAKEGKKEVFWIEPPTFFGEPTILYVLGAKGPDEHAERVHEWARSVWEAWSPHHETVRRWAEP